jgi:hypothetical protein
MIKNETSSAVYGLFYNVDYESSSLLGLYFLEGEAEAARASYIATNLEQFGYSEDEMDAERESLERQVVIRKLAIGQTPDFYFAA